MEPYFLVFDALSGVCCFYWPASPFFQKEGWQKPVQLLCPVDLKPMEIVSVNINMSLTHTQSNGLALINLHNELVPASSSPRLPATRQGKATVHSRWKIWDYHLRTTNCHLLSLLLHFGTIWIFMHPNVITDFYWILSIIIHTICVATLYPAIPPSLGYMPNPYMCCEIVAFSQQPCSTQTWLRKWFAQVIQFLRIWDFLASL